LVGLRREPSANFGHGRVCQGRPVAEDNRRHSEIAIVDASHDRCAIGMILDVDLAELDAGTIKL
jgi:hypothetical protein